MWRTVKSAAYSYHTRRLGAHLAAADLPLHVAIVMDGNRRWARQAGFEDARVGHRYGAEHLDEVLRWCVELGIRYVTVFVASVDNLRKRDSEEIDNLLRMIEEVVADRLTRPSNLWRVHPAGRLDVLPDSTRHALKRAEEATRNSGTAHHLNVAIGYDGREEIINAVRCLL